MEPNGGQARQTAEIVTVGPTLGQVPTLGKAGEKPLSPRLMRLSQVHGHLARREARLEMAVVSRGSGQAAKNRFIFSGRSFGVVFATRSGCYIIVNKKAKATIVVVIVDMSMNKE